MSFRQGQGEQQFKLGSHMVICFYSFVLWYRLCHLYWLYVVLTWEFRNFPTSNARKRRNTEYCCWVSGICSFVWLRVLTCGYLCRCTGPMVCYYPLYLHSWTSIYVIASFLNDPVSARLQDSISQHLGFPLENWTILAWIKASFMHMEIHLKGLHKKCKRV